jgi:hypothetical protein
MEITLKFEEETVKCYIWSIALCDAETWTLRVIDQKVLKCSVGEGWRSVGWIV